MLGPTPKARLEGTLEISSSPEEVWSVLGNFRGVTAWAPALSATRRTTGPDVGVGSRRAVTYRRLFTMEQAVTEWTEHQSLTYAVFRAPWPLRDFFESWTVTPSVSGSRVHVALEYGLWFGAVGRFVHWAFTRHVLRLEMRWGLEGLKSVVEKGHR